MRLVGGRDDSMEEYEGGDEEGDYGSADDQHLEAHAFRLVQILPKECVGMVRKAFKNGVNHPVIFLCDVSDPMGLAFALKFTSQRRVDRVVQETGALESKNPGILLWYDLDHLKGREPTIHGAVQGQMGGLMGYFPIVVVARGGFSVFPWPMEWLVGHASRMNLMLG